MNSTQSTLEDLIRRARQGDGEALGELLENHRPYLKLLALRMLDARVEARVDASDLVQQTCLSVHRNIKEFVGSDEAQFLAWLRQIHERNVHNAFRDNVTAQRRSVEKEERLEQDSLPHVDNDLKLSSPSQRMMQGEDAVQLAEALEQLPPDQCTAVRLRYLEGLSLKQLAERMDRSEQAVVGLVWRGLKKLKEMMT